MYRIKIYEPVIKLTNHGREVFRGTMKEIKEYKERNSDKYNDYTLNNFKMYRTNETREIKCKR